MLVPEQAWPLEESLTPTLEPEDELEEEAAMFGQMVKEKSTRTSDGVRSPRDDTVVRLVEEQVREAAHLEREAAREAAAAPPSGRAADDTAEAAPAGGCHSTVRSGEEKAVVLSTRTKGVGRSARSITRKALKGRPSRHVDPKARSAGAALLGTLLEGAPLEGAPLEEAPLEGAPLPKPLTPAADEAEEPAAAVDIPLVSWLKAVITRWGTADGHVRAATAAAAKRKAPRPFASCSATPAPTPTGPPAALRLSGAIGADTQRLMGLYQLTGRVVNERAVWRLVGARGQYLAYSGFSWMVQTEASLGSASGFLSVQDDAASPDLAASPWKAPSAGGWHLQSSLVCRVVSATELPPPAGLKLEGSGLDGEAAAALGLYKLAVGRSAHGLPVWRHTAHPDCWLASSGDGSWFAQPEAALGSRVGWLSLADEHCPLPYLSGTTWHVAAPSGWQLHSSVACVEAEPSELPPPFAVRLSGVSEGEVAQLMGTYRLLPRREAKGRPVWRLVGARGQYLAYSGVSWMVQTEASLGSASGFLSVQDDAASPDLAASPWKAPSAGGWQAHPSVSCDVVEPTELPPPQALRLRVRGDGVRGGVGSEHPPAVAPAPAAPLAVPATVLCRLGHFTLLPGTSIHSRPVYAHSTQPQWLLASTGDAWALQPRHLLGEPECVLALDDAVCPSPDLSRAQWRDPDGGGVVDVVCESASRLPGEPDVRELYRDSFTDLVVSVDGERVARPGRGEGLLDGAPDLSLFATVSPNDLLQGSLGNCWLVSSLAAIAESEGAVRSLCSQQSLSRSGRYDVTLFHPVEEAWLTFTVDDRLPVEGAGGGSERRLRYTRASAQSELWPALYEKAFAKMFGGYASLRSNSAALGLKALSGCLGEQLLTIRREGGQDRRAVAAGGAQWSCYTPVFTSLSGGRSLRACPWPSSGGPNDRNRRASAGREWQHSDLSASHGTDEVVRVLRMMHDEGAIMCAASEDDGLSTPDQAARRQGGDERVDEMGVVLGHAYSILDVVTNVAGSGFDLLQLRNPWAKVEWSGDWGDHSPLWEKHPAVGRALGHEGARAAKNDGIFWMSASDFAARFESVSICRFDADARRLQLEKRRRLPPTALAIEAAAPCGAADAAAAAGLGLYKLVPELLRNDRPVWRHATHPDRWLACSGRAWNVQSFASLGERCGWLSLPASSEIAPDVVDVPWRAKCAASTGGGEVWTEWPSLGCREAETLELPPPPALRLEGVARAEARELMGLYRLLPERRANGRPVWQSVGGRRDYLAHSGSAWMVQRVAGCSAGVITAHDDGATPDLVEAMWKVYSGGAWEPQPLLSCFEADPAELPPPAGLKLEGSGLDGEAAAALGLYKLAVGRSAHGLPVWRHTAHPDCWLASSGDGSWFAQPEAALGSRVGWLSLADESAAAPSLSGMPWESATAGRWELVPGLRCVAAGETELPPPRVLKLSGATDETAAALMGLYQLVERRVVNERPVWKWVGSRELFLAYTGVSWMVQTEASLGSASGFLSAQDDSMSAERITAVWSAPVGCGWEAQRDLTCAESDVAELPPPTAIRLSGMAAGLGAAGAALGLYKLTPTAVNGRSAWRRVAAQSTLAAQCKSNKRRKQALLALHHERGFDPSAIATRRKLSLVGLHERGYEPLNGSRLVFDGDGWYAGGSDREDCLMLPDTGARPELSKRAWLRNGDEVPSIACEAASPDELPPPLALRLEGAVHPEVEFALGEYALAEGKRLSGRPVWRSEAGRYIAFSSEHASWLVQGETSLGTASGFLNLRDTSLTPDLATSAWFAPVGRPPSWEAQPGLRCSEVDPEEEEEELERLYLA